MFLQRFRERLVLLLIVLLPFHAFLVTAGTKILEGPGHAPLGWLAVWKEGLLGIVLLIALLEIVVRGVEWKMENGKWKMPRFDAIDVLIVVFLALGSIVSIFHFPFSIAHFLYGFKYDFLPLTVFLVLRRVHWSAAFGGKASQFLIGIGAIVVLLGLVMFLLPQRAFEWLGYSAMHSLYVPGGSLAAFQQIGGTVLRRMQSVMSGPNQLGLWLLLPFSFVLASLRHGEKPPHQAIFGFLLLFGAGILLTFSRAALLAAFLLVCVTFLNVGEHWNWRKLLPSIGAVAVLLLVVVFSFPDVFLRAASSRDHFLRPLDAVQTIVRHPFGLGLGTAGPASNRTSDACVYLPVDGDASWAEGNASLCVFLGETQVLPIDRECRCPFLPENWYLQIGVELGIVGFTLFITLVLLMLRMLRMKNGKWKIENARFATYLAFLGVSIAALFLHAWEDSAVAYTLWILAATVLRPRIRSYAAGGIASS
ncbi:MAG: hypothetical protein PHU04_00355 [Candidatus Peribacteraceae bacterium]|nr:hypothetical protein [Candidatus Peribacteraceae bacterium]